MQHTVYANGRLGLANRDTAAVAFTYELTDHRHLRLGRTALLTFAITAKIAFVQRHFAHKLKLQF